MRPDAESIIADLSVRLFEIPPQHLDEAVTASRSSRDASIVDELVDRGYLGEEEGGFLRAIYEQLRRHESATKTGHGPAAEAVEPLSAVPQPPPADGEHHAGFAAGPAGRYTVRHEHARGGMGRILAVWDQRMHREVALKEIRPSRGDTRDRASQERVIARFLQEARITGRLQHPSIIPVHEIGERPDGTLYYTMKFVRGRTLQQAISEAGSLEARMALLPHYLDLCQAVAYAHAHGVIHRDIKPSNVMIGEFGETLVIDWGLAKEFARKAPDHPAAHDSTGHDPAGPPGEADPLSFDLTMDGQLLGTPHYMSPEQAAGKHDTLDERSDVYSLGAVLYEILTGSRPYRASTGLEVLRLAATNPPDPPEAICPAAPRALAAICRRAMQRAPEARYPSAELLAREIARFQTGALVDAHQYRPSELVARFVRRYRREVAIAAVALILLASLGAYSYLSLRARHAAEQELRVTAERERYDLSIALAQQGIEAFQYDRAEALLAEAPPAYRGWEWGRLNHVIRAVRQPIATADEPIWEARASADARFLVTSGPGGVARIWDLERGRLLHDFVPHTAELSAIAMDPRGQEFATGAVDGAVKRWDRRTGALLARYQRPEGTLHTLAYTPDGQHLLGGGASGVIREWDLASGGEGRAYSGHGDEVNAIAVSPDGNWIAAGDATGIVYLWDRTSGTRVLQAEGHTDHRQVGLQGVLAIAFSPDSSLFATGGADATAKLWRTGDPAPSLTFTGHLKRIRALTFSPDGQTLVTDAEGELKRWETGSGAELDFWIRLPGTARWTQFLPDSNRLLTVGPTGGLTVWDLDAGHGASYLTGHTEEVNAVRFSPDGRYVLSTAGHWLKGGDGRVLVWDLGPDGQATPDTPWQVLKGAHKWTQPLAFHPNGRLASSGDARGRLLTWDWRAGRLVDERAIPAYTNGLRCVAYSPDGRRVATAGWAEEFLPDVTEWDAETGARTGKFVGGTDAIDSMAYSPDGRHLAAGNRDGSVLVWDAATRERRYTLDSDFGWVYGIAWSPDGRTLASSHDSLMVQIWDVRTGAVLRRLEGLQDRGNKVVFSPDGTRVASCDTSATKVWNAITGAPLLTLPHGAYDVAFSPDGRILATAGVDGRVGLWRATEWQAP